MKICELAQLDKRQILEEKTQSSMDNLAIYTASMKKFSSIMEKINQLGKENEESPEMFHLRQQLNKVRADLLKQAQ